MNQKISFERNQHLVSRPLPDSKFHDSLKFNRFLILLHLASWTPEEKVEINESFEKLELTELFQLAREQSASLTVTKKFQILEKSHLLPESWKTELHMADVRQKQKIICLKKLINTFAENKISLVPLKGGLLGPLIYRDLMYKKMNDFDFIVPRQYAERSIQILGDLGFLSFADKIGKKNDLKHNHHTFPFYSADFSCVLGLHWNLVSSSSKVKISEAILWNQPLVKFEYSDSQNHLGNSQRFEWEWHLLHLCIHLPFYKTGIRELADVANLILFSGSPINWTQFLILVNTTNSFQECFRVLSLTQSLNIRAELIPHDVLRQLREHCHGWQLEDTLSRSALGPSLILKRSTLPAKIEKAFVVSLLSKEYRIRMKAWVATWVLCFYPHRDEVNKISLHGSRRIASQRILKLLIKDHGFLQFWGLTFYNVGLVIQWSIRQLFNLNPPKDLEEKETMELLRSLE